jgi:hypothetical protein
MMKCQMFNGCAMLVLLVAVAVFSSGCGQGTDDGGSEPAADASQEGEEGTAHAGWWCVEHGIPEEECSMCSSKAADECKAKGDWCDEHNRAESQCFKCDPSRAEKFAALYEAKIGEKPPQPTE